MAERIPQSVAIRVPLQAFLASDHFSPATGLTIVVTISKNGAAYGNPSGGATNAVEIANGSYYVDLSTTDTGTVGPLFVRGAVATMDPITSIYNVVDAHNAGFDGVPAVIAGGANGLWILGSNNTAAITIGALTTGAISATTIATSGTVTLNALTVSNATTLTGAVSLGSTLSITGTTTLAAVNTGAIGATTISTSGTVTLNALTVTNNVLVSGSWTVTGASTFTGNVAYANGVFVQGGSQVHALSLSAAAGGDGLRAAGNTTGSGINAIAGTTGHGMKLIGGSVSGDGLNTSGGAGGGDGIEAVGTGAGVDINADIVGNLSGSVGSVSGAVGSVAGAVGSVTGNVGGNVVGTVAGVTPSTAAQVAAVLTTQMTESYRANGAAPTLAQAHFELLAHLGESGIVGTTKTINQLDHVTPAETFTLDSATAPTAITRAT